MDGIYNILNEFDKAFGLKDYYESLPDGSERIANLNEFYALLKDEALNKENFDLEEFLNETTLLSEQDGISGESISIMSVHASKGLEFEHLFVIGSKNNDIRAMPDQLRRRQAHCVEIQQ